MSTQSVVGAALQSADVLLISRFVPMSITAIDKMVDGACCSLRLFIWHSARCCGLIVNVAFDLAAFVARVPPDGVVIGLYHCIFKGFP